MACKPQEKQEEVPVEEDTFARILEAQEINVATLSGSMTYFMYKGEEMGYEYELIRGFADNHRLRLNLYVAENMNRLLEMLDSLEVDLITYNIPITLEGKEKYIYCGREVQNEQVLVQRNAKDSLITDVTALVGRDIWVIRDSKYHKRLENLNDELGGGIHIHIIEEDSISREDLIEMVSEGKISGTISDFDLARLNRTYYSNLDIRLQVSHPQRASWAVRNTSASLAQAIDEWFAQNENTPSYQARIKRYFELSKLPGDTPVPLIGPGQISPYDDLFKQYAKNIDWDWRLLASIAFQESKFHTDKVSWAGATGLMGLMPRTARAFGITHEEMTQPEPSIRAATAFIGRLCRSFSKIENEEERLKFIVASYNAGSGHIYDAQALAEKYGKDKYLWSDVEEYLKLKNHPDYYNDPVVRNGYFRSKETVHYVGAVIERWHYYQEKVK
ncbi:transglycosylase SLT domain-containing protein [Bacteroidales bacterium OttesenSCG-928-L03]|nr:transglycosylase SLT domain-containing protein [Bacteroidales bacterium OttesenSCG-928-L03]